ncbi:MAG: sigma-70 family RNA polymerase sigma factor [Deltaproteobacteria bacterium]|nr:sigma-70 family RNA polymerase sigma factor [Deltaproteobacteria bacterium]
MTILNENRELLDAFRRGEHDALTTVYRTYANAVLRCLQTGFTDKHKGNFIKGVANISERLDLLQDVFLRAFSKSARESYDGIRPYHAFLLTIARNRLIDYWRAHARDPVAAGQNHSEGYGVHVPENIIQRTEVAVPDEEDRIFFQHCLEASEEFVSNQSARHQQFIAFRFKEELPLLEVARQLNMTRWKARALEKQLQLNLEKYLRQRGLLRQ